MRHSLIVNMHCYQKPSDTVMLQNLPVVPTLNNSFVKGRFHLNYNQINTLRTKCLEV
jgi:hypothetical protein